MPVDLEALARFLLKSKTQTYAGDGKAVSPERPGFKELLYEEGDWSYRDSYVGFYSAPGQEIVRFKGAPVWSMSYFDGMLPGHRTLALAKQTFAFLKEALSLVEVTRPFRGPESLSRSPWRYHDSSTGDIADFVGTEEIFYYRRRVFKQTYGGGLILPK